MNNIIIKRLAVDDVVANDGILFNTNNHWETEKIPKPIDYNEKLSLSNTKNWINLFHNDYFTITLDTYDLRWIKEAAAIGMITKKFSHIYDDELDEICRKYKIPPGKYFVRSERVSLKCGMHGPGPYSNMKEVIESMVTTSSTHQCFAFDDTVCTLYFMRWIEMDYDKEFRIFVYNNDITALSTQHLYNVNKWLNTLTDYQVEQIINKIVNYFDTIKSKLKYISSYVMDLALIGPDETPYFIEPNSFGRYYASGSSLYHWVNDHDKLHDSSTLELRYTNI